jgi:hypothetical protein
MAKDFLTVNGATLQCSLGSTPSTLSVPSSQAKAQSQNIGVVTDKIIGTFGTCPNLGPGPCAPSITGNWSPGCTKNKLSGTACIKKTDTLMCSVGGTITITNAGQTKVKGE